jgi:hypothetical protein
MEDLPNLAGCVVDQDVASSRIGPPPAESGIKNQPEKDSDGQDTIDGRDAALGPEDGIVQRPPGPDLAYRECEHRHRGDSSPGYAEQRMARVVAGR